MLKAISNNMNGILRIQSGQKRLHGKFHPSEGHWCSQNICTARINDIGTDFPEAPAIAMSAKACNLAHAALLHPSASNKAPHSELPQTRQRYT